MKTTKTITLTTTLLATIALLSGCGSSGGDTAPVQPTEPTVEYVPFDAPTISANDKQAYLKAVNDARATGRNCGATYYPAVPPLEWSNALYGASYEHSDDMASTNILTHDGSGTDSDWTAQVLDLDRGSNMQERGANNGYDGGYIGENAAMLGADNSLGYVMRGWLASEGHCLNIMRAEHTHFGMARVENMWTQILAYKY